MITLDREFADRCAAYFRREIEMDQLAVQAGSFWVAGGAVRQWIESRTVKRAADLDIWTNSKESANEFVGKANSTKGWTVLAETEKATTWRNGRGRIVQLITGHVFDGLAETLAAFDFTICQFGVQLAFPDPIAMAGDTSFQDLAMRRLVTATLMFPESSIQRALKYAGRGFTMCGGELAKLLDALERGMIQRTIERANDEDETGRSGFGSGAGRWTGLD